MSSFPLPLIAIAGVGVVSYGLYTHDQDGKPISATTNYALAKMHLAEADRCFANAIDGLRQVHAAPGRPVIGDRKMTSKYLQHIIEIRERLHLVDEESHALWEVVLPEINPADED